MATSCPFVATLPRTPDFRVLDLASLRRAGFVLADFAGFLTHAIRNELLSFPALETGRTLKPQVIRNDLWCHSRIFVNPLKKRKFEKGTKGRLLRSLV